MKRKLLRVGAFFLGWVIGGIILLATGALGGCTCDGGIRNMSDDWCNKRAPAQSWDQENLKRNDHGCPTAIFIAPGGVLEECP